MIKSKIIFLIGYLFFSVFGLAMEKTSTPIGAGDKSWVDTRGRIPGKERPTLDFLKELIPKVEEVESEKQKKAESEEQVETLTRASTQKDNKSSFQTGAPLNIFNNLRDAMAQKPDEPGVNEVIYSGEAVYSDDENIEELEIPEEWLKKLPLPPQEEHFKEIKNVYRMVRCSVGMSNPRENRYLNINPYNWNGILVNKAVDPKGKYINGSLINLPQAVRKHEVLQKEGEPFLHDFIATQAPLPASKKVLINGTERDVDYTFPAFWLMAWENRVPVIVLLTDFVEGPGGNKAQKYWPDLNVTENYGAVKVSTVEKFDLDFAEAVLLKLVKDNQEQWVYHLHYRKWKDDAGVSLDDMFNLLAAKNLCLEKAKDTSRIPYRERTQARKAPISWREKEIIAQEAKDYALTCEENANKEEKKDDEIPLGGDREACEKADQALKIADEARNKVEKLRIQVDQAKKESAGLKYTANEKQLDADQAKRNTEQVLKMAIGQRVVGKLQNIANKKQEEANEAKKIASEAEVEATKLIGHAEQAQKEFERLQEIADQKRNDANEIRNKINSSRAQAYIAHKNATKAANSALDAKNRVDVTQKIAKDAEAFFSKPQSFSKKELSDEERENIAKARKKADQLQDKADKAQYEAYEQESLVNEKQKLADEANEIAIQAQATAVDMEQAVPRTKNEAAEAQKAVHEANVDFSELQKLADEAKIVVGRARADADLPELEDLLKEAQKGVQQARINASLPQLEELHKEAQEKTEINTNANVELLLLKDTALKAQKVVDEAQSNESANLLRLQALALEAQEVVDKAQANKSADLTRLQGLAYDVQRAIDEIEPNENLLQRRALRDKAKKAIDEAKKNANQNLPPLQALADKAQKIVDEARANESANLLRLQALALEAEEVVDEAQADATLLRLQALAKIQALADKVQKVVGEVKAQADANLLRLQALAKEARRKKSPLRVLHDKAQKAVDEAQANTNVNLEGLQALASMAQEIFGQARANANLPQPEALADEAQKVANQAQAKASFQKLQALADKVITAVDEIQANTNANFERLQGLPYEVEVVLKESRANANLPPREALVEQAHKAIEKARANANLSQLEAQTKVVDEAKANLERLQALADYARVAADDAQKKAGEIPLQQDIAKQRRANADNLQKDADEAKAELDRLQNFADEAQKIAGEAQRTAYPVAEVIMTLCSAGVGRTGTFIVMDIYKQLIDQGVEFKDLPDVWEVIENLREQRPHVVTSFEQYKAIVHFIYKYYQMKRGNKIESKPVYLDKLVDEVNQF
jgi:protein tyrosine phosphatase